MDVECPIDQGVSTLGHQLLDETAGKSWQPSHELSCQARGPLSWNNRRKGVHGCQQPEPQMMPELQRHPWPRNRWNSYLLGKTCCDCKDGLHWGVHIEQVRITRPASQCLDDMIREAFLSRSSGSSNSKAAAGKLPGNASSLKGGLQKWQ